MSLGVTVLALAVGLAPVLVLHLVVRMSGGRPQRPGNDGQPTEGVAERMTEASRAQES
jgi:hypothetical protein